MLGISKYMNNIFQEVCIFIFKFQETRKTAILAFGFNLLHIAHFLGRDSALQSAHAPAKDKRQKVERRGPTYRLGTFHPRTGRRADTDTVSSDT